MVHSCSSWPIVRLLSSELRFLSFLSHKKRDRFYVEGCTLSLSLLLVFLFWLCHWILQISISQVLTLIKKPYFQEKCLMRIHSTHSFSLFRSRGKSWLGYKKLRSGHKEVLILFFFALPVRVSLFPFWQGLQLSGDEIHLWNWARVIAARSLPRNFLQRSDKN